MFLRLFSTAATALAVCASTALAEDEKPTEPRDAISKLAFLVGNWEGAGISYAADGAQTAYFDTEYVRFDLDQAVLLINAKGQRADGSTSYQLHTVIYYDVAAAHYVYTPYAGRTPRSFQCELEEGPKLLCLNKEKNYRLSFQRLPDGKWNEFGERLSEGTWSKSFETRLTEVAAPPE